MAMDLSMGCASMVRNKKQGEVIFSRKRFGPIYTARKSDARSNRRVGRRERSQGSGDPAHPSRRARRVGTRGCGGERRQNAGASTRAAGSLRMTLVRGMGADGEGRNV